MNLLTGWFDREKDRRRGRRILAAAAAVLMAGAISGCQSGGKAPDENAAADGAAKGRFIETEIALPDSVKDMAFFSVPGEDKSPVFYFFDGESEYRSYIYDGTDWTENTEIPRLPEGITMGRVFTGHDGKLYAGGYGEGYVFHLFEMSGAGEAKEVFTDVFKVPEGKEYGAMPDYLMVLKNGNLLMSEVSGAGIYAPDGKKILSLSQDFIGMDIRLPALAGEDYYLTLAEGGGRLVRYDTETGAETGSFDVPEKAAENRMNMTLFADEEGGFYAAGPTGLYHTGKDGTIWEQLIDGTLNSMGRQDLMVRSFSEGKDGDYYGVYGKTGKGQAVFLHYVFDESVDTVPPETVSVYALRDNKTVRQAAAVLQKNNPQIRVDFRIAVEDEEEAVTEDVIRALNTELLNGKGADVLILDGLPAESYREKKILKDMTDLVTDMKQELLPAVTDGFVKGGQYYYLPARVNLPVVYGEPEAVEARKSLDKMKAYDGTPTLFSADIYENMLRQTAYTCYQEIFKEDGSIDAAVLKNYLEAVKSAGEKSGARTAYTEAEMKRFYVNNTVLPDGFGRQGAYALVLKSCAAAVEVMTSIDDSMLSYSAAGQGGYTLGDVNGICMPVTLVGINASGANPAGAEAFVKTLFGSEVQDESLWNGFPVRNDSLNKWVDMDKESTVSISSQLSDVSLQGDWPAKEKREELIGLVKSARTPAIVDQSVMQMIVDGSKDYFDGKETVEGAVSSIENKIGLYMAERES